MTTKFNMVIMMMMMTTRLILYCESENRGQFRKVYLFFDQSHTAEFVIGFNSKSTDDYMLLLIRQEHILEIFLSSLTSVILTVHKDDEFISIQ